MMANLSFILWNENKKKIIKSKTILSKKLFFVINLTEYIKYIFV